MKCDPSHQSRSSDLEVTYLDSSWRSSVNQWESCIQSTHFWKLLTPWSLSGPWLNSFKSDPPFATECVRIPIRFPLHGLTFSSWPVKNNYVPRLQTFAGNSINFPQQQINIFYNLVPYGLWSMSFKGCHDVSIYTYKRELKTRYIHWYIYSSYLLYYRFIRC